MPPFRLSALVGVVSLFAGLTAAEESTDPIPGGQAPSIERPTVPFRRLPLVPLAQLEFFDERLRLHPKAAGMVGWDSNVYQSEDDEIDDGFVEWVMGMETRYALARNQLLVLDGELNQRSYFEEDERDLNGGRADLEYARESATTQANVEAWFERRDDPLIDVARSVERDDYGASAAIDMESELSLYALDLSYQGIDYREGTVDFDEDNRDHRRFALGVAYGRLFAEHRRGYIKLSLTHVDFREDVGQFQDSEGAELTANYRLGLGVRTGLAIAAGVGVLHYDDEAVERGGFDDDLVVSPVASFTANHEYSGRGRVNALAALELRDSSTASAARILRAAIGVDQGIAERWSTNADLSYVLRSDVDEVTAGSASDTTVYRGRAELVFKPRGGIALRSGVIGYVNRGDREGDDFDRLVARLEGVVVF